MFFAFFGFEFDDGHAVHRAVLVNFDDLALDLDAVLLQVVGFEQKAKAVVGDTEPGKSDDEAHVRGNLECVHGYAYSRKALASMVFRLEDAPEKGIAVSMKFNYQPALVIFLFIAMFTIAAAAPVGKVFQVKGNTVEITGPGVAGLKTGAALQIVTAGGKVDIRVKQTFHSKVTATVTAGNAAAIAKGDAVFIKGKEPVKVVEPVSAPKEDPVPVMKTLLRHTEEMTPGWDIFTVNKGRVAISYLVQGTPSATLEAPGIPLKVRFEVTLSGTEPNHEYTAGMHLFNGTDLSAMPEDTPLGYNVGQAGSSASREGVTAVLIARDFGPVKTDAQGNGTAAFEYDMPAGQFHFQFTIRSGQCLPDKRIFTECNTVFRSGQSFGKGLIHFKYP